MKLGRAAARLTRVFAFTWALAFAAAGLEPLAHPSWAQDSTTFVEPEIGAPVGFVNDRAGVLSAATKAQLVKYGELIRRNGITAE